MARDMRVAGSELVNALTELALDGTSIADPAKVKSTGVVYEGDSSWWG